MGTKRLADVVEASIVESDDEQIQRPKGRKAASKPAPAPAPAPTPAPSPEPVPPPDTPKPAKPTKPKRKMTEKQIEACRINLAKGQEKLRARWERDRAERAQIVEELIAKRDEKSKNRTKQVASVLAKTILENGRKPAAEESDEEEHVVVVKKTKAKPKKKVVYVEEEEESDDEEVAAPTPRRAATKKSAPATAPSEPAAAPAMRIKFF